MTSSEGVGKQVGPAGGLSKVFEGLTASPGGRAAFRVDDRFSSFHSFLPFPPPPSSLLRLNFCYLPFLLFLCVYGGTGHTAFEISFDQRQLRRTWYQVE